MLTPDEFYHASLVTALFQFYNAFVDVNGVDELTREGYEASGRRLSAHGYAPPAAPAVPAAPRVTPSATASSRRSP